MTNLYKLTENNRDYVLGEIREDIIHYDFINTLSYLDMKGKLCYGPQFKFYEEDLQIIYKLLVYTIRDKKNCEKQGMDLNKGILLTGPVGCGKTSLMNLVRHLVPRRHQYQLHSARAISFEYQKHGHVILEKYTNTTTYCFDDLGLEQSLKHYGNDCNVLGEILLSRYELFVSHKAITHATTNLNAHELEKWYGNRVRSRMRQLFNLIAFPKGARDKR